MMIIKKDLADDDDKVFTILTGVFAEGKTFQNLKVSSPAPVTIVCQVQLLHLLLCNACSNKYIYEGMYMQEYASIYTKECI